MKTHSTGEIAPRGKTWISLGGRFAGRFDLIDLQTTDRFLSPTALYTPETVVDVMTATDFAPRRTEESASPLPQRPAART
ncbi:hypothetical protein [Jonesia quinghaiensis]|uniref:hypothetical protein n=1 Tax=Jonesia quinghaiensis TaxID=262806 RepID=UPI0003F78A42|nr:hypothetical protein [Jonesia quinghaiensis]